MFDVDFKSTVPIFEQIVQQVGKYIALGLLKPNDQLPTIRTLAKDLGINPNTVAKAYHECELNGMIYSLPGKGSYVSTTDNGVNELVRSSYLDLLHYGQRLLDLGESKERILEVMEEKLS